MSLGCLGKAATRILFLCALYQLVKFGCASDQVEQKTPERRVPENAAAVARETYPRRPQNWRDETLTKTERVRNYQVTQEQARKTRMNLSRLDTMGNKPESFTPEYNPYISSGKYAGSDGTKILLHSGKASFGDSLMPFLKTELMPDTGVTLNQGVFTIYTLDAKEVREAERTIFPIETVIENTQSFQVAYNNAPDGTTIVMSEFRSSLPAGNATPLRVLDLDINVGFGDEFHKYANGFNIVLPADDRSGARVEPMVLSHDGSPDKYKQTHMLTPEKNTLLLVVDDRGQKAYTLDYLVSQGTISARTAERLAVIPEKMRLNNTGKQGRSILKFSRPSAQPTATVRCPLYQASNMVSIQKTGACR